MGKGDKKSRRGKIVKGTYGNSRRKDAIKARMKRSASQKKAAAAGSSSGEAKPKRTTRKKTEA